MGLHHGFDWVKGGVADKGVSFGCLVEGADGDVGTFSGSVQGCADSRDLFSHGGDGEFLFHLGYPVLDGFGSGLSRVGGADGASDYRLIDLMI